MNRARILLLLAPFALVSCAWQRPAELPTWDAGVRGGIPDIPVETTVTAEAINAGGSAAIQQAIDTVETPGAVQLPAGTFELDSALSLRSGVVLRGAGSDDTQLVFEIPKRPVQEGVARARGSIVIEGRREAEPIALTGGYQKGSKRLEASDASSLLVGDMIVVFSENDPDLMYTDPRWDVDWAAHSIAQIVHVTGLEENTIAIDTALRLEYKTTLQPRIQKITPIEDAGVESLSLRRVDDQTDNVIGIEAAANCWVRDVQSAWTGRGHIWMNFCRFITIEGNETHHAFRYGGGGNGYGIVAGNVSTDCLVIDNVLHHLRHALMTKRGSSGNVFAYNFSTERRREPAGANLLCDISVHGHYSHANLFEGNVVEFVELGDYWGPTGPGTTFFRNRVKTHIAVNDHSHQTFVIGNFLGDGGVQNDGTSRDLYLEANTGGDGQDQGDNANRLPASLYFQKKPAFWTDLAWPVSIEAKADGPFNPAQERWLRRLK